MDNKKIKTALISVFHKENLDKIVLKLHAEGVRILSTGGTQNFVESLGVPCDAVEDLTSYPSILGGRVKTLHPKVFGGILCRRENETDQAQIAQYEIPEIDLVIVDLYPFEKTVASGASEQDIIEKIDIGGISLIRAAAKNFADVVIVASQAQYAPLMDMLEENGAQSSLEQRKFFAKEAFAVSSLYDSAIFNYFDGGNASAFRYAKDDAKTLRYGENPHQKGYFYGNFDEMFEQLQGKEISYNNLLDIDSAINLISEFDDITFAILKHNNACGLASRPTLLEAWNDALAGDPVSAFGGVLIANAPIDKATAEEINKIFFEVIIAPDYDMDALEILSQKKNRIILIQKPFARPEKQFRSLLNGVLVQDRDNSTEGAEQLKTVTEKEPTSAEIEDMIFANKIVKHTKSNAIVLAKNKQLCASGVGQTSRVDALRQAIEKAGTFNFDLNGAVMASDAFFPFPDCVEIASKAGVTAVIQPGGSIKDNLSVDYCNENGIAMVTTGIRHFKH
ncbi:MAG: bifunctional phosphoribosylaminoimidazolecarboxamide formyltransferase/IMP cyclohydrolase [Paludibacteraceae bacterium]|jgi:phosphoribosylaminoimidazolecarboxamide formyltransferase/IMP cyclohydrolase|nr:bifunctional phosphoribosylaminoimidazolecarboxamide formyltransferase/IMP cyclohydrolase [Paludibacteraceae bacterium]MEE1174042.1 bifunctional phosphoribosylaminoimidazolecarboxamide formyltransferase/IMP cyclohydrolase [Paludibacteraceae bacterium]